MEKVMGRRGYLAMVDKFSNEMGEMTRGATTRAHKKKRGWVLAEEWKAGVSSTKKRPRVKKTVAEPVVKAEIVQKPPPPINIEEILRETASIESSSTPPSSPPPSESSAGMQSSPYRWTSEENQRFVDAVSLYGRDWRKVHAHVGTRTRAQIRSHAQKYFQSLNQQIAAVTEPLTETEPSEDSEQPEAVEAEKTEAPAEEVVTATVVPEETAGETTEKST
ncbi:hypothetical protein FOZ63_011080 [Perkinsus olseni]|uniref:Uncharacterized protein n=2 Tax=Perkinsus olseni TaxID=32597 RepID=A0A7J6S446_PEROL|nr:hypothetical protein FOZ63_011080 [Perkinsus olseni]